VAQPGLAQPMWAELGPARKIKIKNRKINKKIEKYVYE
jgi:hypothetical protein